MARKPRVEFPGAHYHIMSRGNGKQKIFLNDGNRTVFLERLADVVEACSWTCFAYCLMDNHYHLLIETAEANLSEGMRNLNSSYSQWFNRKHDRVGHVMQGRYKSPLVVDDSHLLELSRYIVLNPVRSGLTREPGQWRWSSYRATVGLSPSPSFLTASHILRIFSGDPKKARKAYRCFVYEGLRRGHATEPDGRVTLDNLLGKATGGNPEAHAICEAHLMHGYKIAEIAACLGVHRSTIYRAIKNSRGLNATKDV